MHQSVERLTCSLSAVGGYIMRVRARLGELNALTPENEKRLEALRARMREEGNRLLKEKFKLTRDLPESIGSIAKISESGQEVTVVSTVIPKKEDLSSAVRVQRDGVDKALTLWKAEDLAGANQTLTDELQNMQEPRKKAGLLLMRARILHESGDDAQAVKDFGEARKLDPNNPMIDILIAQQQYESGDLAGAQKTLKDHIAANPGNKPASVNIWNPLQIPMT